MNWKIVAGVALVFLFIRMGATSDQPDQSGQAITPAAAAPKPEPKEPGSRIDAFVMSKQFIEDRLKAPRTAHFPSIIDDQVQVESLGEGRWRVRAFVDAENSFGGEVRTPYKCVLRTEDGEKWYPEVVELYQ